MDSIRPSETSLNFYKFKSQKTISLFFIAIAMRTSGLAAVVHCKEMTAIFFNARGTVAATKPFFPWSKCQQSFTHTYRLFGYNQSFWFGRNPRLYIMRYLTIEESTANKIIFNSVLQQSISFSDIIYMSTVIKSNGPQGTKFCWH
jgi:hypothetical protein